MISVKSIAALLVFGIAISNHSANAQFQTQDETPYFAPLPSPTGIDKNEDALFEARPILTVGTDWGNFQTTIPVIKDYYFKAEMNFDPLIRMSKVESNPVRMPNYRIYGSALLSPKSGFDQSDKNNRWSLALEHGHYSNGQEGCTFKTADSGTVHPDLSGPCDTVYFEIDTLNLQNRLNRITGEFSTNFIRTKFKWQTIMKRDEWFIHAVEITPQYTRLVDWLYFTSKGGYVPLDTKYYPMNQYGIELAYHWRRNDQSVFAPKVQDFRTGLEYTYKPSENEQVFDHHIGIFANVFWKRVGGGLHWEYGQDPYNVRLVDKIERWRLQVLVKTEKMKLFAD
jgi:hypothetical protein